METKSTEFNQEIEDEITNSISGPSGLSEHEKLTRMYKAGEKKGEKKALEDLKKTISISLKIYTPLEKVFGQVIDQITNKLKELEKEE